MTDIQILQAALKANAGGNARAIEDPEEIRGKVEAVITILLGLVTALRGKLTIIGILMNVNIVLAAVRELIDVFKKPAV